MYTCMQCTFGFWNDNLVLVIGWTKQALGHLYILKWKAGASRGSACLGLVMVHLVC
jgi:hypothetical protein